MKKIFVFLLCLLLILIFLFILLFNGIIWFVYPSKIKFPLKGIDISHHQGEIDWEQLKTQDLSFVYIKATEGDDFIDKQFQTNWEGAKKINLLRGAYHFYSLRFNGEIQAANFIKVVPNVDEMLPPVIDLEYGGNSKKRPLKSEFQQDLIIFLEMLTSHYGKKPIFYTTYTFYQDYLYPEFGDYNIWIRDIFFYPSKKYMIKWIFWQYKNRGRVKGITGFVDLNVFKGNIEQLINLMNKDDF